ncbi:MAG: pimeloyl-ACP methyl ester esterase BioH [Thiohalomonadales bacterium]
MLYYTVQGQGPSVVLLHGWGLNRHVWSNFAGSLAAQFRTLSVDLPGYGRSPSIKPYDLVSVANAVASIVADESENPSGQVAVVGWSLGGLVAMQLAMRHPKKVTALITMACCAQFVVTPTWPYGVANDVLDQFGEDLCKDHRGTVLRFLAIQSLGSEHARKEIKALKQDLFCDGEPDTDALLAGLQILQGSRLQPQLCDIKCPTLMIVGSKDSLVNAEACYLTAAAIPHCETYTLADAGHAPFLSHPKQVEQRIVSFLCDENEN